MFQLFVQHESKWPSEQKYSNTNHLEPMKVYENVLKQQRKSFSPIFLGITAHFTTLCLESTDLLEGSFVSSQKLQHDVCVLHVVQFLMVKLI